MRIRPLAPRASSTPLVDLTCVPIIPTTGVEGSTSGRQYSFLCTAALYDLTDLTTTLILPPDMMGKVELRYHIYGFQE